MVNINKRKKPTTKKSISNIFSKVLYKTRFSNKKANKNLLEIDILKDDIQKDLLAITTCNLEETYIKLLNEENPIKAMQKRGTILFCICIKKSCENFFTKHYGFKVKINLSTLKQSLYTKSVLKDTELLFKVPFYALFDSKSPPFRALYSPVYNYASESFLEAIIDHLVLEISNCIVYFSILQFSSIDVFRQTLYRSKFLSLRNLERFKNNLTWQLYIKTYIKRPISLYNNRYEIYVLRTSGINSKTIFANRSKEILALTKVPLLTIVIIETRDFIVSRLDETIYFLSKGLRFTLTSVLGQIIGLIWRGIIEGLKK